MAATRLTTENVRIILMDILNNCEFYGCEGKSAENISSYTAGVLDMANAVMAAIKELGGK